MAPLALALTAFTAMSGIMAPDPNTPLTIQWVVQDQQTSVFKVAIPMDSNFAGWTLSLVIVVGDQDTQGGSGGVFSGFDLDFFAFDHDGIYKNGDEFSGTPKGAILFPGGHPSSPYVPTALHPGPLFGTVLDANGNAVLHPSVATLGTRDAAYSTTAFAVDTCSGWVSLGDGGYLLAGFDVLIPDGNTLYLYVGDAGQRSYVWNGTTYNEDPLMGIEGAVSVFPEPGTATLIALGGIAALRRRRRAR